MLIYEQRQRPAGERAEDSAGLARKDARVCGEEGNRRSFGRAHLYRAERVVKLEKPRRPIRAGGRRGPVASAHAGLACQRSGVAHYRILLLAFIQDAAPTL